MFESTVIESRKVKIGLQKFLTLPVSIAIHVIVIPGIVFGAVWNISFPMNSPAHVAQYSGAASPPPPPPPPRPPSKAAATTQVVKPVEIPKNIQEMAPTSVPDTVKAVA